MVCSHVNPKAAVVQKLFTKLDDILCAIEELEGKFAVLDHNFRAEGCHCPLKLRSVLEIVDDGLHRG